MGALDVSGCALRMADSTIHMVWVCRLKKRFGAEFMEVVQPSRCLLGFRIRIEFEHLSTSFLPTI